ncbi:hypothetical protein TNCV_1486851 [Trichonephila clavipes]|nr:hypothetical protein TNCV_1486851 [Trichonephila clavipes]
MTLYQPHRNSLAVLIYKILSQFTGPKREVGGQQTCLSRNRLAGSGCVTCCAVFFGTTAPGHHDCSSQNEKVSNHGSIPITIDCNVVLHRLKKDSTSP